jgi:hypothetical protein
VLPQGVGGLAILFYFISFYFNFVYSYNTHQVLVVLPQGLVALLFYIISIFIRGTAI